MHRNLLRFLFVLFVFVARTFGGQILHRSRLFLIVLDLLDEVHFLGFMNLQHDVLRLDVGVDHLANAVHVVQSHQDLPDHLFDNGQGDHVVPVVTTVLDQIQQGGTDDFKRDARMFAKHPVVEEMFQLFDHESFRRLQLKQGELFVVLDDGFLPKWVGIFSG